MPDQQTQSCIDACNACALACDHCAMACLDELDPGKMAHCIALDMDCAQICRMGAAYMARGSELTGMICLSCAEACDRCAEECSRHAVEHCQACAQACRSCATECRRMAGMIPGMQAGFGAGMTAH